MILPQIAAGIGIANAGAGLTSSFTGGGSQQPSSINYPMPGMDYSPLYASLLTGKNQELSQAGVELNTFLGDYIRGRKYQDKIGYEQTMGQFGEALNQQQMATGLQTGVASMLAGNAIGLGTAEAKSKLATQMLGVQDMAAMRQNQRDAKMAFDSQALTGSQALMQAGVAQRGALAQIGATQRGQLAQAGVNQRGQITTAGIQGRTTLENTGLQGRTQLTDRGFQILRKAAKTSCLGRSRMARGQNLLQKHRERRLRDAWR